jgi:hypothetical protein
MAGLGALGRCIRRVAYAAAPAPVSSVSMGATGVVVVGGRVITMMGGRGAVGGAEASAAGAYTRSLFSST